MRTTSRPVVPRRAGHGRRAAAVGGNQAVRRAIAVLKSFGDQAPEMALGELSRRVGLHKSTAYRLLCAFEDEGLIARNFETGRYRLGPELIVLGEQVLRQTGVRGVALPFLRDLAARTGERVDLEILSGANVVTIEEIAGRHVVAATSVIGMPWAAHATSNGKVLLAHLGAARQRRVLPRTLKRFTSRTIVDPVALARELETVRAQGYAVSLGELEEHLVAIGCPIFARSGDVVAALSISGPDTRLTPDHVPGLVRLGLAAGARISARLGYAGAVAAGDARRARPAPSAVAT